MAELSHADDAAALVAAAGGLRLAVPTGRGEGEHAETAVAVSWELTDGVVVRAEGPAGAGLWLDACEEDTPPSSGALRGPQGSLRLRR